MKNKKGILKVAALILAALIVLSGVGVLIINSHVKNITDDHIITAKAAEELRNVDCILVLGCGVRSDGTPSAMLQDRLDQGIELYFSGVSEKLLMSGDHGRTDYDEVNVMKQYAVDKGVPDEDIFMDHAGFSTYESIYRAKEIFTADNIVIVTQEYHLYRSLYIAHRFLINAHGVSCDKYEYYGQTQREIREVLARVKDFFTCIFKPEPTFLGEAIPVNGDGNITNDK